MPSQYTQSILSVSTTQSAYQISHNHIHRMTLNNRSSLSRQPSLIVITAPLNQRISHRKHQQLQPRASAGLINITADTRAFLILIKELVNYGVRLDDSFSSNDSRVVTSQSAIGGSACGKAFIWTDGYSTTSQTLAAWRDACGEWKEREKQKRH